MISEHQNIRTSQQNINNNIVNEPDLWVDWQLIFLDPFSNIFGMTEAAFREAAF